jgi:hypothetical protein
MQAPHTLAPFGTFMQVRKHVANLGKLLLLLLCGCVGVPYKYYKYKALEPHIAPPHSPHKAMCVWGFWPAQARAVRPAYAKRTRQQALRPKPGARRTKARTRFGESGRRSALAMRPAIAGLLTTCLSTTFAGRRPGGGVDAFLFAERGPSVRRFGARRA